MTRYEQLQEKADNCLEKARNTKGLMQSIWLSHHYKLKKMMKELTIEQAEKTV